MRSTIKHWAFAIAFAFALPYAPPVSAAELAGPQRTLISSTPAWVFSGAAIDLNFAANEYWLKGASGPLVVSRASAKTCADLSGNYIQVSSNVLCRTNAGALVEELRTNGIRNNTMAGIVVGTTRTISGITGLSRSGSASAVLLCSTCNAAANDLITISGATIGTYNGVWLVTAATANTSITFTTATSATDSATGETVSAQSPGLFPTNMGMSPGVGIGHSIIATGTYNGINTFDVAIAGVTTYSTPTVAANIYLDSGSTISSGYGQTWSQSAFVALVGGALPTNTGTSAPQALVQQFGSTFPLASAPINSTFTRFYNHQTLSAAGAGTYILPELWVYGTETNPSPNYFVLRIGWPQLELNPLISASVASAVTAASGTGGTNGTAVYSVTGGTCTTQPQLNVTWTAGVLTVNSVANAGLCSVLPPSPATLAYVSGTATGWTGATVTLTPTNNSAQGFATSPILTSSGAATRAAENDYYPLNPIAGPVGLYAIATPEASASEALTRYVVSAWNNVSNFTSLARYGGAPYAQEAISGTVTNVTPAGTWAQNTSGKLAGYFSNNSITALFNNGAVSSGSPTGLASGLNGLYIGSAGNGTGYCNCTIARVALAPSSLNGY